MCQMIIREIKMKKQSLPINLGLICSLLFCLAFACKSGDEKGGTTQSGPPSESEIKRRIEKDAARNEYPTRKESVEFHGVKLFPPEQSDNLGMEGMPAGKKTTYYPVSIQYTYVANYSDGSVQRREWDGLYRFWRGLDGEWAYNAIKETYK